MNSAVAITGIQPPPVCNNAGWTGIGVVYGRAGRIEYNPLKWFIQTRGPHEFQLVGVDDINPLGRAIRQIVFVALRIDEADVERHQLTAGNWNSRQALRFRVQRRTGTGNRAEEHTSELKSHSNIQYAVF